MTSSFHIDTPAACLEHATMFVAFELGKAKWEVGIVVPGSGKLSRYVVDEVVDWNTVKVRAYELSAPAATARPRCAGRPSPA
jgi:hypothetical protein